MADWAAKRFWKETKVEDLDGGFTITLDGRGVKTPAKTTLVLPSRALAERIAEEWDAQVEVIDPTSMPATRGANAALDKVTIQFDEVANMLCDYGDSDLLCYRAAHPKELADRQAEQWNPVLDWAAESLGARLEPRIGVMHAPQDADALSALKNPVFKMSVFEMAAFHDLVTISGSLVLGLAVAQKYCSAETAWTLSQLDETYQSEVWGADEEADEMAAKKRESFLHAAWFFEAAQK